jgi:hypothetical protein
MWIQDVLVYLASDTIQFKLVLISGFQPFFTRVLLDRKKENHAPLSKNDVMRGFYQTALDFWGNPSD